MLTTLKKAKEILGIPVEETADDPYLYAALQASQELIESLIGYELERKRHTQTVDGPGTHYLILQHYPIREVFKLKVCDAEQQLDSFRIESKNGILFRRNCWPCGDRIIDIEYEAGYILPSDDPNAPASDLPFKYVLASILLAQIIMREQGVNSETVGDISVSYSDTSTTVVPLFIRSMLGI